MYTRVAYVGQMPEVRALNQDFVQNVLTPVAPQVARRLCRSPEFLSEEDFLARQAESTPAPPELEAVTVQTVNAPDPDPSAPTSKTPTTRPRRGR